MGESESAEQKAILVGIRKRFVKITENKMDQVSGNTLKFNGLEEPGEKCSEESSPDSTLSNDVESTTLLRQTAFQEVKDPFLKKQRNSLKQTEQQMTETVDQLVEGIEAIGTPKRFLSFTGDSNPNPQREKTPRDQSTGKQFLPRNSVLTDLLEINNYQTIFNVFIAILLLLFLKTVVHDIVETGTINFDFQMIRWAFGNLRTVATIWVAMMFCTLAIVYPAFNTWAHSRSHLGNNRLWLHLWDSVWLIGYIVYISLVIFVPAREVAIARLPPASAMIVLLEQLRLFMKTHAFVRSNIPRARSFKPTNSAKLTLSVDKDGEEDQDADSPCPDFSKYLYFLFAPTLIYSDSYPRTKRIRWSWVARNFAQVVGIIFYFYFIFVRCFVPTFRQFGSADEPFTDKYMILPIFGCMMPGILVLLCVFFCLLHSWMNANAEMLRFADRMFYKDWWNSTSYASFFRTWNVLVHDWLYTYVYKDVRELCGRGNRVLPMLVVFAISSAFHEYVITFTYHNFNPVHLVMFGGFGTMFSFITVMERIPRLGNIFLWVTLIPGSGMLLSLYAIEFYARINCPPTLDPWLDFFVPRSWTCRNI